MHTQTGVLQKKAGWLGRSLARSLTATSARPTAGTRRLAGRRTPRHRHTPPCKVRRIYTVCILQGGAHLDVTAQQLLLPRRVTAGQPGLSPRIREQIGLQRDVTALCQLRLLYYRRWVGGYMRMPYRNGCVYAHSPSRCLCVRCVLLQEWV